MTPGARVQAAIDCLELILAGQPAEKVLTNWARRSRFAGSKDRAAVRDHVFDALRCRDSFARMGGADALDSGAGPRAFDASNLKARQIMIGQALAQGLDLEELFNGKGHAAEKLSDAEKAALQPLPEECLWNLPVWSAELLAQQYGAQARDLAELMGKRAPVDLRVNLAKITTEDAAQTLLAEGIATQQVDLARSALRVTDGARKIKSSQSYLSGQVELQDAASQALCEVLARSVSLSAQMRVLDYCAGGGGKSLALAAQAPARFFAHDINSGRMRDIPVRAQRAGAKIKCVTTSELAAQSRFDLVLCDVPCSGSGTWRRTPDEKWRLTRGQLDYLLQTQETILQEASAKVAQGGYLAYATCSLFEAENQKQIDGFMSKNNAFEAVHSKAWTLFDGGDGLFVSLMKRA